MTDKPTFKDLIQTSETPVFVDFWAEWCGPCRMVAPAVKQLAEEFSGRLKVVKINVDENPDVAGQYGIQSIPTFMMFKNGKSVLRFSGALPYPAMKAEVEKHFETEAVAG